MNCETVGKLIPLYFYGELDPQQEDQVDQHLGGCGACARELDRQRSLAAALDERTAAPPAPLLEDCRTGLMAAIQASPRPPRVHRSPWASFLETLNGIFSSINRVPQPVGALALVALGFFGARLTGAWNQAQGSVSVSSLTPGGDVFATVRSVHPDPGGQVQIAFDETRRRVISGPMDDASIQKLLLAAAHEENASVRVESMDLLKSRTGSSEVRDALLNAAAHDPNDGVRLKALEGLKPLAADPQVRTTLAQVLQNDANPAVRMQVVDLLTANRDDSVVGIMQRIIQREDNDTVRLKLEKALKEMNASLGTF